MTAAELRALHAAATPGEWFIVPGHEPMAGDGERGGAFVGAARWTVSPHPGVPGWDTDGGYAGYGIPLPDAALIVTTHNLTPLLVALWEAAKVVDEHDHEECDALGCVIPGVTIDALRAALRALEEVGT